MSMPTDGDLTDLDANTATEDFPIREGLPRSYRMRADAHYVEQLDRSSASVIRYISVAALDVADILTGTGATGTGKGFEGGLGGASVLEESIARLGVLQPILVQRRHTGMRVIDGRKRLQAARTAGLREVPCLIHDVSDQESAALANAANALRRESPGETSEHRGPSAVGDVHHLLGRTLDSLRMLIPLLPKRPSCLAERVSTDLLRAELSRASCLLKAGAIVQGDPRVRRTACSVSRLFAAVVDVVEPELMARGYRLQAEGEHEGQVMVDLELVTTALCGIVLATSMAADGHADGRIHLRVSTTPSRPGDVTFLVAVAGARVPWPWPTHLSERPVNEQPDEAATTLFMRAATMVAEAHHGEFAVRPSANDGVTTILRVSSATPRS